MANSVIGALRVNLGLDSAKFQKGLAKSQSALQKFGQAVKVGLAVAVAAVTAAFAGMGRAVKGAIDDFDNLAKTSRQIGVSVEALSQLRFAAELAGIEFGQLTNGLGKFAKSMSDSVRTATSEQALAFKALGISVVGSDGHLRDSLEVMKEVANRFSVMEDSAGKTALAMSIFGRAGRTMIPLLNEGAAGMEKMMQEADALGLTISTKTAKAAEQFNDTMTRIRMVFQGVTNRLTQAMLPALQSLATWMLNASKNTNAFRIIGQALGGTLRLIASGAVILIAQFKALVLWIGAVAEAASRLITLDFSGAFDSLSVAVEGTKNLVKDSLGQLNDIWSEVAEKIEEDAPVTSDKIAAPLLMAAEKTKKAKKALKVELTDAQKFMRSFVDVFQNAGAGVFENLIDGTFRFRDALKNLLSDLGSLLANNVMRQLLTSLAGGSIGPTGGGAGGLFGALPGFASGGSFNVGGAGGIDSQLVAFRASPDETVSVTKPGQESNSGGNNVTIINESKATVEQGPQGTDAEGNRFQRLYVRDAIHEALPSGLRRQQGFNIRPIVARR